MMDGGGAVGRGKLTDRSQQRLLQSHSKLYFLNLTLRREPGGKAVEGVSEVMSFTAEDDRGTCLAKDYADDGEVGGHDY